MKQIQSDVLKFHKKFNMLISGTPAFPDVKTTKFRIKLIKEELWELLEAHENKDLVEVADAVGDLIYVLIGMTISYGIDMIPVWNEIQQTNMSKEGGGKRKDGKVLKPEGWKSPDISGILKTQGLFGD